MTISPKQLEDQLNVLSTRKYDGYECHIMTDIINDIDDILIKKCNQNTIIIKQEVFSKLYSIKIHEIIKSRIIKDILDKYREIGWIIKIECIGPEYDNYYLYKFYTKEFIEQTLSHKIKTFFKNILK